MRPTVLLLCLALGGCAGATATSEVTGSAPAAKSGAAKPKAAAATSPLARAAQAQAEGDHEDWWKDGVVTREKINAMCWMKYENGRKDMPVEKRADLVNDCVQQALKEHPLR